MDYMGGEAAGCREGVEDSEVVVLGWSLDNVVEQVLPFTFASVLVTSFPFGKVLPFGLYEGGWARS